jgi:phosphoglucomutase
MGRQVKEGYSMVARGAYDSYRIWVAKADASLQEELAEMSGKMDAIEDAFWRDLSFGTGGLRGTMGAGTNRMNVHTVAQATQGLAEYLNARIDNPSVAIAHDSRHNGAEFSRVTAEVLAANGIQVHLFPRLEPTPTLSFAVRYLECSAGVCVTASHNPREYNGYKVYDEDGCQITTEAAKEIQAAIDAVDIFEDVKRIDFDEALAEGLVSWISEDCLESFVNAVARQSCDLTPDVPLRVVYTPLNGTGLELVSRTFERIGNVDMRVVPEQKDPDGDFPTCPYPNPEIKEALQKGLEFCEVEQPDLLLATDPDADRCGIAVKHDGQYQLLTGNQVGVLLMDYLVGAYQTEGKSLEDAVVVTTVVSSAMADAVAEEYGFELRRTLTGFKYIGEQIGLLEKAGREDRFMFGFEESYGYLRGSYVRDKDAVVASMLICQMARYYKSLGQDLVDVLESLYRKFGYWQSRLISVGFRGESGVYDMMLLMDSLRENPPAEIACLKVIDVKDYSKGLLMPVVNPGEDESQTLPDSNVLEFDLEGGSKLIVRPSGTEPKCKAYLTARAETADKADSLIGKLDVATRRILDPKGDE